MYIYIYNIKVQYDDAYIVKYCVRVRVQIITTVSEPVIIEQ